MAVTAERSVECTGDGRARGLAHGEALRAAIHDLLERWDADVAGRTGRAPDAFVSDLVGTTGFAAAIGRHTPGLLEEVRGIAEGAGAGFERILALNLMDEEWWFSQSPAGRTACSVVAVGRRGARPPLIAQNMDLPVVLDGAQAVLQIEDEHGAWAAVLSAAGMIGLTGVNGEGLGVCVNALPMLAHSAEGLPVAFCVRAALERRSARDAAAFLAGVPHASGQHYALAGPDGVRGYECSAGGTAPVAAGPDGRLCHTNHPLASADLDPGSDAAGSDDSHVRMQRLEAGADALDSASDCERLLADRDAPLCVVPGPDREWMTFGAIAAELDRPPRVRIALGPPDRTPWRDVAAGPAAAPDGKT